jgi:NgoPII restriction endonuclease
MTNLLQAVRNIVRSPISDLVSHYQGKNRINGVGDALEVFIKDAFAGTINATDETERVKQYSRFFSYHGNQNNPPDLMLRNGDAVEVKKLESRQSQIALNSSYPKSKLFSDSPMITGACRRCEDWVENDLIYAIGVVGTQKLRLLWLIYGDCYAASREHYERIRQAIADGITKIPDIEFSKTKELGRVNKVDPLGITYLRIRGMWGIDNPIGVYDYLETQYDASASFQVIALMRKSKYNSFPIEDRDNIENISLPGFGMTEQEIKSPDNPAELLPVKVISYKR